ncbi:flagellar hook-associated protein FlgK [bacterium F16]|nr:flagellar hook-associated protein FlgK [bacterium F16]
MSSLNIALYTSQSSLLTTQRKMAVTSNNLANVDKEGYHRQIANSEMNHPIQLTYGQFGTGVHITGIVRAYDVALETGYQNAVSEEGNANIYYQQLYQLEGMLSPTGSGSPLTDSIRGFADALQSVANRPEANDSRLDLIAKADNVAIQFNEIYSDITGLRDSIATVSGTGSLATKVDAFNNLATELNQVNDQISTAEARLFHPTNSNDLRDRRDQIMVEMSKLADVSFAEETNNAYTVSLGGIKVVDGLTSTVDTLVLDMSGVGGSPALTWASGPAATISEGEITGLTDAWNYHNTKASELLVFATNFQNSVNTQLTAGFKEDGTAGTALFTMPFAGQMSVLISDPDDVAASVSATESGNGENMLTVWNTLNTNGFLEGSEDFVNSISGDTANAYATAQTAIAGRTMFQESIASLSAVSLDEEMIEMLSLQRVFQASSRVVSAVDRMLEQAIAMV